MRSGTAVDHMMAQVATGVVPVPDLLQADAS
jgi:hypothetical protein